MFEPRALDELLPEWREDDTCPVGDTPVTRDDFLALPNATSSVRVPDALLPPQLDNHGNYIISLSQLTRWLGEKAEEMDVDIFPGFAASEVLYTEDGTGVRGVATRDAGIDKEGEQKPNFERGYELRGRCVAAAAAAAHAFSPALRRSPLPPPPPSVTLFAEGARGSCSEDVIGKLNLREGKDEQTYGLGIKEVWKLPKDLVEPGLVQHTIGYPLQSSLFDKTFGGSFLYHMAPDLVLLGVVVGLDYENPYVKADAAAAAAAAPATSVRPPACYYYSHITTAATTTASTNSRTHSPRLLSQVPQPVPGVPAVEAPPGRGQALGGRRVHSIRRAGPQRGRPARHPQVGLPRRRAHR